MQPPPPPDGPLWEWTRPPCWARQDKGRHRAGWTQKGRLHCQPRMAAVLPSSHTSGHPEPTSPLTGRNLAPVGSVVVYGRKNKNHDFRHWFTQQMAQIPRGISSFPLSTPCARVSYGCVIVLVKSPRARCNLASRRRWWWWSRWGYLPCTSQSQPVYSGRLHPAGCCPASSLWGARRAKCQQWWFGLNVPSDTDYFM